MMRAGVRASRALGAALVAVGRGRIRPPPGIRGRADALREALAEQVAIHDLRISVAGAWPTGPAVMVCNHVSYLDPVVIAGSHACVPIAKGEVQSWPVIGAVGHDLGVLFVDRASVHSGAVVLRRALAALRAGVPVLNFPEGTTTNGNWLLPFRRGVFGLAQLAGVPVVPIALSLASPDLAWTGGATFLPHYLRTAARRAPAVHLEVGAPIDPSRFASAGELAVVTHHRIARMLRAIPEPHGPAIRHRVPAPRPDAVLPVAARRAVAAR